MTNAFPVAARPVRVARPNILDALMILAFDFHRNREPFRAIAGLDPVSVAPVATSVLNVVIQNELVDGFDEVEVALPGNIVRLNDRKPLHWALRKLTTAEPMPVRP